MGTQFIDIYRQNEILKNDQRLNSKITNQIYSLYAQYLDFAIGEFEIDCYKDLETNLVPFSQAEYEFIANGTDNQFLLQSPNTPATNCLFYVGYAKDNTTAYTEITSNNYIYNSTTNILTITNPTLITAGYLIYVSAYVIGSFAVTLNKQEINILNQGMLVPWDMEHVHRDSLLAQKVYGGSQKLYSQAQHISSVNNVMDNQYFQIFKGMIRNYTYRYNQNKTQGLAGGLCELSDQI